MPDDSTYVERHFSRLNDAILEQTRQISRMATLLETHAESFKEIARAQGEFRSDIQELMGLGPMVREALEKSAANARMIIAEQTRVTAEFEKRDIKITDIERWRQRRIGAHAVIGAAGGLVVLATELLIRWFIPGHH